MFENHWAIKFICRLLRTWRNYIFKIITNNSKGPTSFHLLYVFQIDFVAHDDIPYSSAGSDDVYKHIKEAGGGLFLVLFCVFSLILYF